MKRVLSWLVLAVCDFAFTLVVSLDLMLLRYVLGLYGELSAFLKIAALVLGGSFVLALAAAPLFYGIPLIHRASEAVCESRKGMRYTVYGIVTLLSVLYTLGNRAMLADILVAIYGISFIVIGHNTRKEKEV